MVLGKPYSSRPVAIAKGWSTKTYGRYHAIKSSLWVLTRTGIQMAKSCSKHSPKDGCASEDARSMRARQTATCEEIGDTCTALLLGVTKSRSHNAVSFAWSAEIQKQQGFDVRPLKQGYDELLKAGFEKAKK